MGGPSATPTPPPSVSTATATAVHAICGLGLPLSNWIARYFYSHNLVSNPLGTIRLALAVQASLAILCYSFLRRDRNQCSLWKAIGRGAVGLVVGALVMAAGAIVLGAPVGIKYWAKTAYWSLLMSSFTVVPAASVFGSSWEDWKRLFADTKPSGIVDYMVCIPAHAAVIGAWIGAWPMPLDWERPWQEWPICVTYGAAAGYLIGLVVSAGFILFCGRREQHVKGD
ncbi:hypothetical protein Scep_008635 [Stephania cephalantha]|uniref:Phosphatidylinositol-glycan biosynthesis class F protein n=1 Tax=Stephania cephalantha TaxID=152367 RepID=A0AAP0KC20_9MAGN